MHVSQLPGLRSTGSHIIFSKYELYPYPCHFADQETEAERGVSAFTHLLEDPQPRRIFMLEGRSKMEANGGMGRSFAPTWMQDMCRLNLAKGWQREEKEVVGQLCQATHTKPDLTLERIWVATRPPTSRKFPLVLMSTFIRDLHAFSTGDMKYPGCPSIRWTILTGNKWMPGGTHAEHVMGAEWRESHLALGGDAQDWLLGTQSILAVLSSTWQYMTSVPLEWVMAEECFGQQGQHEQRPGGKTLWRIG